MLLVKMERFTIKKQDSVNAEKIDLYGQDLNVLPAFCPNILTMIQINASNALMECTLKEVSSNVLGKVDSWNRICLISIFSELLFIYFSSNRIQ